MTEAKKTKSKMPWILGGITLVSIILIITYVVMSSKYDNFPWKRYIITLLVEFLVVGVIILVTWLIVDRIANKKDDDDSDLPRQIVDTRDIKKILKEVAMRDMGIPFRRAIWSEDDSIEPRNPRAIEIRNERTFTDITGQTSNLFFACELIVREGSRPGVHIPVFRCDLGKEHIRNNWEGNIRDHSTFNTRNLEFGKFPLTSSQDDMMRLATKRIAMADTYSEEELKEMFDPFMVRPTPVNNGDAEKKKKEDLAPIRSPLLFGRDEEPDHHEEEDTIQNDINKYMERNA